jgi:hypothetical protein
MLILSAHHHLRLSRPIKKPQGVSFEAFFVLNKMFGDAPVTAQTYASFEWRKALLYPLR